jgi:hypothetical protein
MQQSNVNNYDYDSIDDDVSIDADDSIGGDDSINNEENGCRGRCSRCFICSPDMCVGLIGITVSISILLFLLGAIILNAMEQKRLMREYSPADTFKKINFVCGKATSYRRVYSCTDNPCCTWSMTNSARNICVPKNMSSYETCPCGGVCLQAEMNYELGIGLICFIGLFVCGIVFVGLKWHGPACKMSYSSCKKCILKVRRVGRSNDERPLLPINA